MIPEEKCWSGFRVFTSLPIAEKIFSKLRQNEFKDGYFNYYFGQDTGCRIGFIQNEKVKAEIQDILNAESVRYNFFHNNENEGDFDSADEKDTAKINTERTMLIYKQEGTTEATIFLNRLGINSKNFSENKVKIAKEMKKKPELMRNYVIFHFLMNPLCFFIERKKVQSQKFKGVPEIYDIEEDILSLI